VDKLGAAGHEQLKTLHGQLFTVVLQTIEAHGGDVVTMSGDAVVVLWGIARGTMRPHWMFLPVHAAYVAYLTGRGVHVMGTGGAEL
jgi:class 3 adenylate cyclase